MYVFSLEFKGFAKICGKSLFSPNLRAVFLRDWTSSVTYCVSPTLSLSPSRFQALNHVFQNKCRVSSTPEQNNAHPCTAKLYRRKTGPWGLWTNLKTPGIRKEKKNNPQSKTNKPNIRNWASTWRQYGKSFKIGKTPLFARLLKYE